MSRDTLTDPDFPMKLSRNWIVLVVPKQHVKAAKSALERAGKLDRSVKITPDVGAKDGPDPRNVKTLETSFQPPAQVDDLNEHEVKRTDYMRIPTTIADPRSEKDGNEGVQDEEMEPLKLRILEELCLAELAKDIIVSHHTLSNLDSSTIEKNPLRRALKEALDSLPGPILATLDLTSSALVDYFPEGYSLYKPMLLLPHNAFISSPWQKLLSVHSLQSATLGAVWKFISSAMGTTHIGVNSPIPLQSHSTGNENILRSPVNLTPIYGNFGPPITPQALTNPTSSDFEKALWVTTIQNNIHQTWAPQYTMFSRGNMREKTRLLHSPSVTSLPTPSAALDMYSGIGYFAFSYRRAGLYPIICFELNPWSVEGLRRGAALNGWSVALFTNEMLTGEELDADADFLVFQMSNVHAVRLLPHLKKQHTIRHVNLGLLPSSRDSWQDAVSLVDWEAGGWIHVHDNVGVADIEARSSEIEDTFKSYVPERLDREVKVEWVEKVKMYAPGVVHCVFDVWFGPI